MRNIAELRIELARLLQEFNKYSLYASLNLTPTCSDKEIADAVADVRARQLSGQVIAPELIYAIDALGTPEAREKYDRTLLTKLPVVFERDVVAKDADLDENFQKKAFYNNNKLLMIVLMITVLPLSYFFFQLSQGKISFQLLTQRKGASISTTARPECLRKPPSYSAQEREAAIKSLENRGIAANSESLLDAIELFDRQTVLELLQAGVNPNALPKGSDDRPLDRIEFHHSEKTAENLAILRVLVEHGAEINNPISPTLHRAAIFRDMTAVEYLLSQCADVNLRAAQMTPDGPVLATGHTPLSAAIEGRGVDVVRVLLNHGANPNQPGGFNMLPLHSASTSKLEIVELLVKGGADISVTFKNGWTPVMVAMNMGNFDIALYLISRGANVSSVTKDGTSAMSLAHKYQRNDIIDALRAKGVKE